MKLFLLVLCFTLHGCTIFYQPGEGRHKGEGRDGPHGGVVIELPKKTPEIKPMPN